MHMTMQTVSYVIVGGGLAGVSAIEGIREQDPHGAILMFCGEKHLPYDRPPLSKKLWFGSKKVEDIFLHDQSFYAKNGVELVPGRSIIKVDAGSKTIEDDASNVYRYNKLLLATGGTPRTLTIPGNDLAGICYYRTLDDYQRMRSELGKGKSAIVIGGGFIGTEIAAALTINEIAVTMIFPEPYIVNRVFPELLGLAIQKEYVKRGVTILANDKPLSIERSNRRFVTSTGSGKQIESDAVIVGIGIAPSIELAARAGLRTGNGIIVDQYLQTSAPDIYAAGDNAYFPYQTLARETRVEHWDNALNQGKYAGRNMAGAREAYDYMPYFFSDLFQFGYEAVGEVNTSLDVAYDWQKEFDTGVVYYLKDRRVRGAMMCNVWDKVETARTLIRSGKEVSRESLRGAIR